MEKKTIIELVNELSSKYNFDEMTKWFFDKGFIIKRIQLFDKTKLYNQTMMITYLNNCQHWSTWGRQARGTILYYDSNIQSWKPIKYMMQRGAEVLTNFHYNEGINETENITQKTLNILHPTQQKIMQCLTDILPIDAYLTTKVDGVLIAINLYTGEIGNTIKQIIMESNDEFGKVLITMAKDTPFVPVISTQKTFNLTDPIIQSYFMTSLLVSFGQEYNTLCQLATNPDFTPIVAMKHYGQELINRLTTFYNTIKSPSESITLCFEAVCPYRQCAWNNVHSELAVDYSHAFMKVLSYSIGFETRPHFLFSDLICTMGFDEPLWWKVDHAKNVDLMLMDLSKYIMGKMSQVDYLTSYPYHNKYSVQNLYLDPEGFVIWSNNNDNNDNNGLDYNKIKSREYYECHKPKNIKDLIKIASRTKIFPMANKIAKFFDNLEEKIIALCQDLQIVLGISDKQLEYKLSTITNDKSPFEYLKSGLSEKALIAFNNQPIDKKCQMLINSRSNWDPLCYELFHQYFRELKPELSLSRILLQMVQFLQPWVSNNMKEKIHMMIIEMPPLLESFYQHIIKVDAPRKIIDVTNFVVFGCKESRDIDVAVIIPDRNMIHDDINMEQLKEQLSKIGYDIKREIDINTIYIKDSNVMLVGKGGLEIQNMILMTYQYHKQAYPCPVNGLIKLNLKDKILIVSKFILDHLKVLIGKEEYQSIRTERRGAYQGQWNRVVFATKVFDKIKLINTNDWMDTMKSLTMKMIQLILLEHDDMEYTKRQMAVKFNKIYEGQYEHIIWFLLRGKEGTFNQLTIELMAREFKRIVDDFEIETIEWKLLTLNTMDNPTLLSDNLFQEFIKSPFEPTLLFVSEFIKVCPNRSINQMFPILCNNADKLPENILNKAILVSQRSKEWLGLLSYYTCGTNSGLIPYEGNDWVSFYYNLIRGAIVEQMVIHNCDFSNWFSGQTIDKITVGLLVESKEQGSNGIAPDLLLMVNKEIIPVEIKCIVGKPVDNADYRRSIKLARKQIEQSCKIIGGTCGIIVIVYVYDDQFDIKACIIK